MVLDANMSYQLLIDVRWGGKDEFTFHMNNDVVF